MHHTPNGFAFASVRITYVRARKLLVLAHGIETTAVADYLSLSPAATLTGTRFSGGESGHDHIGSKAQDGW